MFSSLLNPVGFSCIPLKYSKPNLSNQRKLIEVICDFYKTDQDVKSHIQQLEPSEEEYMFTDPHGDLICVLFNFIKSGVARFKLGEGEPSTVFYDVESGKTFYSEEEFLNSDTGKFIGKYEVEGAEDTTTKYTIDDQTCHLVYRLRKIPNIEPNPDFKGHLTLLGDLIDRGNENEECLYTIVNFISQIKEGISRGRNILWDGEKRFDYIAGNHEEMISYDSIYFNTCFFSESHSLCYCSNDVCSMHNVRIKQAADAINKLQTDGDLKIARVLPNGVIQSHTWWSKQDMKVIECLLKNEEYYQKIKVVGITQEKLNSAKNLLKEVTKDEDVSQVVYSKEELKALVDIINEMYKRKGSLPVKTMGDLKEKRGCDGMLWNDAFDIDVVKDSKQLLPFRQFVGHTQTEIDDDEHSMKISKCRLFRNCQFAVLDTCASSGFHSDRSRPSLFLLNINENILLQISLGFWRNYDVILDKFSFMVVEPINPVIQIIIKCGEQHNAEVPTDDFSVPEPVDGQPLLVF